jgi:hypothetical protein
VKDQVSGVWPTLLLTRYTKETASPVQNLEGGDTVLVPLTTPTAVAMTTGTALPFIVLLPTTDFTHPPTLVTAASSFSVKGLGRLLGADVQAYDTL